MSYVPYVIVVMAAMLMVLFLAGFSARRGWPLWVEWLVILLVAFAIGLVGRWVLL